MSNKTTFDFINKYNTLGADNFYQLLMTYGIEKINTIKSGKKIKNTPDLEFIDYYDKYLALYRKENNEVYLSLSIVFRRAAHQLHWHMIKSKLTSGNNRFLKLVG